MPLGADQHRLRLWRARGRRPPAPRAGLAGAAGGLCEDEVGRGTRRGQASKALDRADLRPVRPAVERGRKTSSKRSFAWHERDRIRVVADQHCTPSYVPHVARAILYLAGVDRPAAAPWGIYHVTNRGATTWHELACEIVRLAGLGGKVVVEPITTAEFGLPAPRPAYSVLDTTAYHRLGGPAMPDWKQAIAEYFDELRKEGDMTTIRKNKHEIRISSNPIQTHDQSRTRDSTGGVREGTWHWPRTAMPLPRHWLRAAIAVALHYNNSAEEAQQTLVGLRAEGVRAEAFQADVSDEASVAKLFQAVMKTFGRLDVLVTAAAVWDRRKLEETTAADVRREFEINALGTFLCCQQAGRIMVGQPEGGAIVAIGDWACARPYANYAAYFLSKGAIPTLTRAWPSSWPRGTGRFGSTAFFLAR